MNPEQFNIRMKNIDQLFQSDNFKETFAVSHALRVELEANPIVDGNMMGWALYYEYRALHSLRQWANFTRLMKDKAVFLVAIGPQNYAYAASLMMEALAHSGQGDDIPEWGAKACSLRIQSDDPDGLKMAIDTSLALLQLAKRNDLRASFFFKLADVAKEEGLETLHVKAQGWASAENKQ